MATAALATLLGVLPTDPCHTPGEIDGERATAELRKGQDALALQDWPAAASAFRSAAQADPTLALARYGLGQALIGHKRPAEAVTAYGECRALLACQREKGMGEASRRVLDQQLRAVRDTLRRFEWDRLVIVGIPRKEVNRTPAHTLAETQTVVHALEKQLWELQEWKKHKDEEPPAVALALGNAHFLAGDTKAAEQEFLTAARRDARYGEAHYNLAVVYLATGRIEEARAAMARAKDAGVPIHPRLEKEIQVRLARR